MYMTRLFQISVLICFATLLTSCRPDEKGPSTKGIKITDLAPQHSQKNTDSQLLKTINFDVFIFEAPAQNIDSLQKIWQTLHTEKLRFNDYNAFSANSFSAGFGQINTLNKIVGLLDQAGAQKIQKISEASQQPFISQAKYIVVVCSNISRPANAYEKGEIFSRQQAGAAIQNFLLKIQESGLSTCWIGYFVEDQIKKELKIPADVQIEAVFPIGYEYEKKKPKRKIELDRILYFNSYGNKKMKNPKKLEV